MASMKVLVSLCLVFLTIFIFSFATNSEARDSLGAFPNKIRSPSLMTTAQQALQASIERQAQGGRISDSKRVSPGGPDPHHH